MATSELAFRIITEDLHQQDMPMILEEFSNRSPKHEALVQALNKEFRGEKRFWEQKISNQLSFIKRDNAQPVNKPDRK